MDIASISSRIPAPRPAWVERFARFGLFAKGIVYCLVGAIAFMAAFEIGGNSGQDAGKQGVFRFLLEQPYGKIMLALVTIGMLCYTLWRFIQAFKDTEGKGTDPKGIGQRVSYAFSGAVYGSLAFYAAKLVLGTGDGGGNGDSRQTLAKELLGQPMGQWLLGAIAVGTMCMGIYQFYRAYSGRYLKKVQASAISPELQRSLIRAGRVGYVARGAVWLTIGYLLLKAALEADSQEAGGSGKALQFLEQGTYGSFLLGAVALGLICYGVFMFVRARYENIGTAIYS